MNNYEFIAKRYDEQLQCEVVMLLDKTRGIVIEYPVAGNNTSTQLQNRSDTAHIPEKRLPFIQEIESTTFTDEPTIEKESVVPNAFKPHKILTQSTDAKGNLVVRDEGVIDTTGIQRDQTRPATAIDRSDLQELTPRANGRVIPLNSNDAGAKTTQKMFYPEGHPQHSTITPDNY